MEQSLSKDEIIALWDSVALFVDWNDESDSLLQENGYTLEQALEFKEQGYKIYKD